MTPEQILARLNKIIYTYYKAVSNARSIRVMAKAAGAQRIALLKLAKDIRTSN